MTVTTLLQSQFEQHIPLSQAMQASVSSYQNQVLELSFPLLPNTNPHGTGFGGSLYCACLLAGWGQMFLSLQSASLEGEIVIADVNMQYLHPVSTDFIAVCEPIAGKQWQHFIKMYERYRKGRIQLQSRLLCNQKVCAHFSGMFVVQG